MKKLLSFSECLFETVTVPSFDIFACDTINISFPETLKVSRLIAAIKATNAKGWLKLSWSGDLIDQWRMSSPKLTVNDILSSCGADENLRKDVLSIADVTLDLNLGMIDYRSLSMIAYLVGTCTNDVFICTDGGLDRLGSRILIGLLQRPRQSAVVWLTFPIEIDGKMMPTDELLGRFPRFVRHVRCIDRQAN